jgi:hypothetical protein
MDFEGGTGKLAFALVLGRAPELAKALAIEFDDLIMCQIKSSGRPTSKPGGERSGGGHNCHTRQIQRIWTEILFIRPLHSAKERFDLLKIGDRLKLSKDPPAQIGRDIEQTGFAIVELEVKLVIILGLNLDDLG